MYAPVSFSYVPAYDGDEGLVLHFAPTAASTYRKGDIVSLSAGTAQDAVAVGSNIGSSQALLGISHKDARTINTTGGTSVLRAVVDIQVFRTSDFWIARYKNAAGGLFVTTDIGNGYELFHQAAGAYVVDHANPNASVAYQYVALFASAEYRSDPTNTGLLLAATQGGPIYVKLKNAALAFNA
jgi:hypothetical protein